MRRILLLQLAALGVLASLVATPAPASAAPNEITTWTSASFDQPNGLVESANGLLWSADFGGGVLRFNPTTGGFKRWDRAEGAQPRSGPIVGPDGLLWFGSDAGLVSFDPTDASFGGVAAANVQAAAGLFVGPDGAIWFASQGTDRIGRYVPGGAVTTYPSANVDQPNDLTLGGDGAIWSPRC